MASCFVVIKNNKTCEKVHARAPVAVDYTLVTNFSTKANKATAGYFFLLVRLFSSFPLHVVLILFTKIPHTKTELCLCRGTIWIHILPPKVADYFEIQAFADQMV